jgi:hypothetical protein
MPSIPEPSPRKMIMKIKSLLLTVFGTLLFCTRSMAVEPSQLESSPWFQRSLVGLEVGPTGSQFGGDPADTGYAAKFDGRQIARATIDFNYHGNPPFSWEVGQRPVQHAANGDFVTGETGVWGFSALTVGLNVEFYRAATPGKPVQVAMQRGVRMYHDQTTRPLNDMRWEMFNLLSHGAFVTMVDKTGFDGWLDPVAYARFGAMFQEARSKRAQFGHTPVRKVGIYYSSRTRDWVGRGKPAEWFLSFQGAHKAMVYEHIPWGVIHEENATLETLNQFAVVLLPNVAILSEAETSLLQRYVEAGGNIIATGLSGTHDKLGQLQSKSSIESLIGASFVRKLDSTDNWVRLNSLSPTAAPLSHGIEQALQTGPETGMAQSIPFLVRGPAVVYRPVAAAPMGELIKPHRTKLHEQKRYNEDWPLSADTSVGPAILLNVIAKTPAGPRDNRSFLGWRWFRAGWSASAMFRKRRI